MKKNTKKTKSQDTALITGNPNDKVVISPDEAPRKYQTEAIKLLKAKLKKPEYTYAGPTEKVSVDTAPDRQVNTIKKLVSKLTTQPVTEEDLNNVFSSLGEAGSLRKLGSIATSPIRAVGLIGKTAMIAGSTAKAISEPDKAVDKVGDIAKVVTNKLASFGSFDGGVARKKQGVSEGLGKDIKRLTTGRDVKSRAGQEITKSQDASMRGDTKTSKKHFDRYDKLDKLANKEQGVAEGKGLWANIHAKQSRIKAGSGERMRKPGSEGAPTKQNFIDASEAMEKITPQEKFKAGLKKAGYDPDAGAKRLTDLLAKQKKEREEHEKKYAHLYENDADQIDESFVVDRAAGYSGVYTAADLGIKIQGGFAFHPSVMEEGGAGDEGTKKLTNKYKKDTPGEQVEAAVRMLRAKRKANNQC